MPIKRIRKQKKETKGYSLMGMSASQAYLLTITSRLADNEFRSQTINNAKMRLATQSSQASENYINALNEANLKISNYDEVGNAQQQLLTYNSLTAYSSYNNQYSLVNSAGQVLVSEAEANAFKAAGGSLDNYLKAKGLEYTTTYFDREDTLNFSAVDKDGAGGYSALAQFGDAATYTYPQLKELYENYNSYDTSPDVKKFDSFHYESAALTAAQRQEILNIRKNLCNEVISDWINKDVNAINTSGMNFQSNDAKYCYQVMNVIKNHLKTDFNWTDEDLKKIDKLVPTETKNGVVQNYWAYYDAEELTLKKTIIPVSDNDREAGITSCVRYTISTDDNDYINIAEYKWSNGETEVAVSGPATIETIDNNDGEPVAAHDVTVNAARWNSVDSWLDNGNSYTISSSGCTNMYKPVPTFFLWADFGNGENTAQLPAWQAYLTKKGDTYTQNDGTVRATTYVLRYDDINVLANGIPLGGDWCYEGITYEHDEETGKDIISGETNFNYFMVKNENVSLKNVLENLTFHEFVENDDEDDDEVLKWSNLKNYVNDILSLGDGGSTSVKLHTTGEGKETLLNQTNFLEEFLNVCLEDIVGISCGKVGADSRAENSDKLHEMLTQIFDGQQDVEKLYLAIMTGKTSGAGDHLNSLDEILKYIATNEGECLSPAYGKYETPKLRSDFLQTNLGKRLIVDLMVDLNGEPKYVWVDSNDRDNTKNADAKAQWYTNLFNRMRQGYKVLENGLASSPEWIEFALSSGIATIEQIDKTNKWQSMDYKSCSTIFEDSDNSAAVAKAEAEYNRAMKDINAKDRVYDLQLKNIDTEHTALQSEYDTVKKIISDNIQRTFQLCKNG